MINFTTDRRNTNTTASSQWRTHSLGRVLSLSLVLRRSVSFKGCNVQRGANPPSQVISSKNLEQRGERGRHTPTHTLTEIIVTYRSATLYTSEDVTYLIVSVTVSLSLAFLKIQHSLVTYTPPFLSLDALLKCLTMPAFPNPSPRDPCSAYFVCICHHVWCLFYLTVSAIRSGHHGIFHHDSSLRQWYMIHSKCIKVCKT